MFLGWMNALMSLAMVAQPGAAQPAYQVAPAGAASKAALLGGEEPAWRPASAVTYGAAPYETTFRALWNQEGLFLRFDASDDRPWHTMTGRDDHIWEEEVVEIFIDPDRSGRNYAELEISPANVVCDVRMVMPWPEMKQDFAWDIAGLETRVVPGPGAAPGKGDWTALAFIPWKAFQSLPSASSVQLPPRAGDRWRANLFRIKRPNGPENPGRGGIFAAWARPTTRSFHDPSVFRDFVFEGGAGR